MAEAFGAVASALQIAEIGVSLATKLYQYAKDVQSSPVDIQAIALEIRVISDVLRQTDHQLSTQGKLATDDAQETARRTSF